VNKTCRCGKCALVRVSCADEGVVGREIAMVSEGRSRQSKAGPVTQKHGDHQLRLTHEHSVGDHLNQSQQQSKGTEM
jgi:hypothetical protein